MSRLRELPEGTRFHLPSWPAIEFVFIRCELIPGRWTFSDLVRTEFYQSGVQEQMFSADLEVMPLP